MLSARTHRIHQHRREGGKRMRHRICVKRSDEIEYTDVFPMVSVRIKFAVLEQSVMQNHDGDCNNEPHKGQILGISVGQESVDPIYFDVSHLPLVLHFISREPDGCIGINLLGYVSISGRAGILLPEFLPNSLAEQAESPSD